MNRLKASALYAQPLSNFTNRAVLIVPRLRNQWQLIKKIGGERECETRLRGPARTDQQWASFGAW